MVQPHCFCRLTWAEINGFGAGRCVWWPRSLHEIIFIPYDVHLHFLLFTCFFSKIYSHTWTKFIQIPNAVYENGNKNCRSYTSFSEATRLNSLCCCKLTRAEINGFGAGRCVWWPRSLHEILVTVFHMMSISFSCSSHVSFERSCHAWTKSELICKQANEVRAMWDAQQKTVLWKQVWVLECLLREIYTLCSWEVCRFETGEFRERLHAQSAQFNSLRLWNFRKLWDRCNPGVNFANVKLVHNNLVCNLWILLARHE